jgi:hypothetical protein
MPFKEWHFVPYLSILYHVPTLSHLCSGPQGCNCLIIVALGKWKNICRLTLSAYVKKLPKHPSPLKIGHMSYLILFSAAGALDKWHFICREQNAEATAATEWPGVTYLIKKLTFRINFWGGMLWIIFVMLLCDQTSLFNSSGWVSP